MLLNSFHRIFLRIAKSLALPLGATATLLVSACSSPPPHTLVGAARYDKRVDKLQKENIINAKAEGASNQGAYREGLLMRSEGSSYYSH